MNNWLALPMVFALSGCASLGMQTDLTNPPASSERTAIGEAIDLSARFQPLTSRVEIYAGDQLVADRHLSWTSETRFTGRLNDQLVTTNCDTTERTSSAHVFACKVRVERDDAALFVFRP